MTQEAFYRFYAKNPGKRTEHAIGCLYVIAKNLCIDLSRKRKEVSLEDAGELEAHTPDADTSLFVTAAVEALPEQLQELILLRFSMDLKIGRIASLLGISRFAVRRRLSKALESLREQLKEECS